MDTKRRNWSLETASLAKELSEISKNPFSQYMMALVRLIKNKHAEERNLMFGRIDYLFKEDKVPENITKEYDDMTFYQFSISIDDVPSLITDLGSSIKVSNQWFTDIHNDYNGSWDTHQSTSNKSYGYIRSEYPYIHYKAKLWNTSYRDPYMPVTGKDLGPYPTTARAIIDLLDLNLRDEGWLNEQDFIILVPDYRARIEKMRIRKQKIQLEIQSKFLKDEDLIAQFYIDGKNKTNLSISNGSSEISSPDDPKEILAVVTDKKTGDLLDYIHYTVRWTDSKESIEKEIPEDIVKEWINRGENEYVEFKEALTRSDDVIKSVVAFANTKGGVILVGVKDDCSIIGSDESLESIKNRFERMIAEKCDPPIEFKIEQVELGQKVTVIKIPKGTSKIYSVTNGAIYVRRGSSDRFIKPSELMDLFENKQRNSESGFGS